ncbi:hypothetical protein ACV347_32255, partial [Pseudomonas aeruginosa]
MHPDEIYSAWRCVWLIILMQVYLIWAAGAGHASFVAAQNVSTVVAYDLSAHMLDVVAQAAEARQLKN